jgi:hypothetical protein
MLINLIARSPDALSTIRSLKTAGAASAAFWLMLLTGCSYNASIHGLRPISPPVRMGAVFSGSNAQLEYAVVTYLCPVFKWEPFVPPPGATSNTALPTNITYDLRIWEVRGDSPGDLVFETKALPAPQHKLERPLKPATRYFWSVRARFEIGGETRLTDWSRSLHPYRLLERADRPGEIPPANYFRFVTSGF